MVMLWIHSHNVGTTNLLLYVSKLDPPPLRGRSMAIIFGQSGMSVVFGILRVLSKSTEISANES